MAPGTVFPVVEEVVRLSSMHAVQRGMMQAMMIGRHVFMLLCEGVTKKVMEENLVQA